MKLEAVKVVPTGRPHLAAFLVRMNLCLRTEEATMLWLARLSHPRLWMLGQPKMVLTLTLAPSATVRIVAGLSDGVESWLEAM